MVARLYENVDCSIEGCGRPAYVRGWCERHHSRWKRYGDPTAGAPGKPVRTLEERRARFAQGITQINDPVALAHSYLRSRRLLGGRDEADLLDVALEAIVDAAVAWDPDGGRSMLSWAWLYMDRNVTRELGRCVRRRAELRLDGVGHAETWRYDANIDPYHQVELRVDLQRWADLAELTPLMRYLVTYAALHLGTYVRDTVLEGATPLHGPAFTTYKLALKHLRGVAVTGKRRDDRWTRMTGASRATDHRTVRSNRILDELRAQESEIIARVNP